MVVRYHPAWGAAFVVLGAACTLLGLWVTAVAEFSPAVLAGIVVLVLGVLYLTRPYFEYVPSTRTLLVKAPIGPMERRFGGSAAQRLVVENGRILCVLPNGKRKRPVSSVMANREQWRAVLELVDQPEAGR